METHNCEGEGEISNCSQQIWENKTWYDFEEATIDNWTNDMTWFIEDECHEAMKELEYWLCGNTIFPQFYFVKKERLVICFMQVLDATERFFKVHKPQVHHTGKDCPCWEYITSLCRWVYKADSMILTEIQLDYSLHPNHCWFQQTRLRYEEWANWFEKQRAARARKSRGNWNKKKVKLHYL